jgi:ankyrin repeat protein
VDVLLLMAASENDIPKVEELLGAGANVNIADNKGRSPLELATKPEVKEMIEVRLSGVGVGPGKAARCASQGHRWQAQACCVCETRRASSSPSPARPEARALLTPRTPDRRLACHLPPAGCCEEGRQRVTLLLTLVGLLGTARWLRHK